MSERPDGLRLVFEDNFDAPELDRAVWLPHYLPAWSSRADTAATYAIHDSCLHLTIPPGQGLWCAGDHKPSLRVSGIQSGNFSGPVGSTIGQQPYRNGLTVREQQETFWGGHPIGAVSRSGPAALSRSGRWSLSGWPVSKINRSVQRRSALVRCSAMRRCQVC